MPESFAGTPESPAFRYAFLLPIVGYAAYIPEFFFGHPNPTWAAFLFLWALSASFFAWWLSQRHQVPEISYRGAVRIVIVLMTLEAILFITISAWQVRNFSIGVYAEDSSYYNQVLWNSLHGHFLAGNVQQERLYNPPVSSDLALHVSPFLLVLLPIYAVFPHFLTLLIIRDLALVAAAWPLFLLARARIGPTGGVAAVILYLAHPIVIAQGLVAFYLLQLAPLPFFWALRAFVLKQYYSFLGWMLLALSMREDVAISMAGFGLWAVLRRRTFRWWVGAFGLPVLWWGIATVGIQPRFGHWSDNIYLKGQENPFGIGSLLGHPSWVLDSLRNGGIKYLYSMLRNVGALAVLGWDGVVALPGLAANLFLMRWFPAAWDPLSRLSLVPACALMGASVLVAGRIIRRRRWNAPTLALILLVLLPSVAIIDGAKSSLREGLVAYFVVNDRVALQEAVHLIPPSASVAAPTYALPALSRRYKLYTIQEFQMYPQPHPDFFLFDQNRDRVSLNPAVRKRYDNLFLNISQSSEYEKIWQSGEYILFRRNGV